MTASALARRRRVLFTRLTTLGFYYPPGHEPAVIAGIRQYLSGWSGIGRIVARMARQRYDLQAHALRPVRLGGDLLPGRDWALTDGDCRDGLAREPWGAVQRAAWQALRRREADA